MFIDENTISTIVKTGKGEYRLTMYRDRKAYFEKEYKTMAIAKAIETKLINKRYKTEYKTIK